MSSQLSDQSSGSAEQRSEAEADRTLDSWKEIADFLGVSVRTAHRWEEGAGMPLHRAPSGRVYARTDELNRWRQPKPKGRWRRWLLGGLLTVGSGAIAATLLVAWPSKAGIPATVTFEGHSARILDANGRTCWTASIPELSVRSGAGWEVSEPARFVVSDLDEDGAVEVLLNVLVESPASGRGRTICYAQDGRVRWEFVFGRRFKDGYGEYAQTFEGHILRVVHIGGRSYVLTIATHRLWHPCQVALLDPSSGKIVEEFWHPGAITHALTADLDRDGTDELVLAGINNPGPGPGSPVLMVLRLPFSHARPTAGSLMGDMSSGGPVAYVVVPRSDMLAAKGGLAVFYGLDPAEPGTFLAHATCTRFPLQSDVRAALTYQFDLDLRLRKFFKTINVPDAHDLLWRAGVLDHLFSDQETAFLQAVRPYTYVPDGQVAAIPPFRPSR